MDKQYYDSLSGLKGIFIVGIVMFHNIGVFSGIWAEIFGYGGIIGNYIFFMLSGFLIALQYRDRICTNQIDFFSYLMRRFVKLYPLYLITNLIQFILITIQNGIESVNWKIFALNLTMLPCGWIWHLSPYNYPAWFVSVLFLCYVVYYLICKVFRTDNQYRICIFLLAIWGLLLEFVEMEIPFCSKGNGQAFLHFAIGCVLYELNKNMKENNSNKLRILYVLIFSLAIGIGISWNGEWGKYEGILFSVAFCPLIIVGALRIQWLKNILSCKGIKQLGKISMAIFYWHIPLQTLFMVISDQNSFEIKRFILYWIILLCVSSLSSIIRIRVRNIK